MNAMNDTSEASESAMVESHHTKIANGSSGKEVAPEPLKSVETSKPPAPLATLSASLTLSSLPVPESIRRTSIRSSADPASNHPSVQSSAQFDGELALSVLIARPIDQASGRRKSLVLPAAVGAFAASDSKEEDAKKKKIEKEARRRHSASPRDQSTFDDRLRRKLEESRSLIGASRRRSSRVSFASSVGSNFESIGEGQQYNFESIGEVKPISNQEETGIGRTKSADCVACLSKQEEAGISPTKSADSADLKTPPEINGLESYPKRKMVRSFSERPSKISPPLRRVSYNSLSNESYEEFVTRKICSRGDVGLTYSERKRRASVASAASTASTLSMPEQSTPMNGENITSTEVHYRPEDVGRFYQPAPRVRDEEEEKVELSSEDDVVVLLEEKVESLSEDDVVDAEEGQRPSHTALDFDEGKKSQSTSQSISIDDNDSPFSSIVADREKDNGSPFSSMVAERDISRDGNDSPFSSMVAERDMVAERKKIVKHDNSCDPEDLLDTSDQPPEVVGEPASRKRRATSENLENSNAVTGSFTTMVDRLRRGATRSLSIDEVELSITHDAAQRRATYAFCVNAEEHSHALRELADMVEAQDVVQATLVLDEKHIETVDAIPMDEDEDQKREKRRRLKKQMSLVWCPLVLLVIVIAVASVVFERRNGGSENDGGEVGSSLHERVYDPTLVQVKKEGVLRCGVPNKYGFSISNDVTGEKEGISVDFCKAVAAAVLGPDYQVDLIEVTSMTRFTSLAGREIDLLIWGDTHTMERDFHEARAQVGFQFTDPYFYDGLGFAGQPLAVQCADNYNWLGECRDLKICVNSGTTHVDILRRIFPDPNLVPRDTKDTFLHEFIDGGCNVIAGEQNDISEIVLRNAGYTGEFGSGEKVLSKEPLAMVTRKSDQSWTDVVNWVLRALIHAEMTNISQENANEFIYGNDHGHDFDTEIDFFSALESVGNYGEIYSRNMEEVVPRKGLNLIYTAGEGGQSGLHYSHPTGTVDAFHYEFALNGKINQILDRGKLVCGVFGDENPSMEADYCRALSASIFASDSTLVEFVELSNEDNLIERLESGDVDVIAGATVDFHSDFMSSNATASGFSGLAFSQPYLFRGNYSNLFHQGPSKAMATSQTDADWSTFVYWVVANLIWAEENGITSAHFRDVPEVKLFGGKFEWMFRGSILAVGNYGEIYERNLEHLPPRASKNLLNDGSSPQLWHPQF